MCLSHLIYRVRPRLIHTCHAMLRPCRSSQGHSTARSCCATALRKTARSEHGMASVNQTRPHSVNQMGKTHSKPLAVRHGRGTTWARHAICESAYKARTSWHVREWWQMYTRFCRKTSRKHAGWRPDGRCEDYIKMDLRASVGCRCDFMLSTTEPSGRAVMNVMPNIRVS